MLADLHRDGTVSLNLLALFVEESDMSLDKLCCFVKDCLKPLTPAAWEEDCYAWIDHNIPTIATLKRYGVVFDDEYIDHLSCWRWECQLEYLPADLVPVLKDRRAARKKEEAFRRAEFNLLSSTAQLQAANLGKRKPEILPPLSTKKVCFFHLAQKIQNFGL